MSPHEGPNLQYMCHWQVGLICVHIVEALVPEHEHVPTQKLLRPSGVHEGRLTQRCYSHYSLVSHLISDLFPPPGQGDED